MKRGRGRDRGPLLLSSPPRPPATVAHVPSAALRLLLAVVVLSGWAATGVHAVHHELALANGQWTPNALTVERHDTVRWCWTTAGVADAPPGGINVVSDDAPFDQPPDVPASFPFRSGEPRTSGCFTLTVDCQRCAGQTFVYRSDTASANGAYAGSLTVRNELPRGGSGPVGGANSDKEDVDGDGGGVGDSGAGRPPSSTGRRCGQSGCSSTGTGMGRGLGPYVGTGSALPPNGMRVILVLWVGYPAFVAQHESVLLAQLATALDVRLSRFRLLLAASHGGAPPSPPLGGATDRTEVWLDVMNDDGPHAARHRRQSLDAIDGPDGDSGEQQQLQDDGDGGSGGSDESALASALYERLSLELSGSGTGVLNDFSATALIRALKQVCADGRITAQCDGLLGDDGGGDTDGPSRAPLPSALVASILSVCVALAVVAYLVYYYTVVRPRLLARQRRDAERRRLGQAAAPAATKAGLCPTLTRSDSDSQKNADAGGALPPAPAAAADGAAVPPQPHQQPAAAAEPAVHVSDVAIAVHPAVRDDPVVVVASVSSAPAPVPILVAPAIPVAAPSVWAKPVSSTNGMGNNGNGNGSSSSSVGGGSSGASVTIDVDLGAIELGQLRELGLTVCATTPAVVVTPPPAPPPASSSSRPGPALPTICEADVEADHLSEAGDARAP